MTQPHPQQEPMYLISERELQSALIAIAEDDEDTRALAWFNKIHSRPHTPAPAENLFSETTLDRVRKAAREQVLDELLVGFKSNKNIICWLKGPTCAFPEITCRNCIIQHLESLRGGAP